MEKIMSVEEKVRRAEEIYERRKNGNVNTTSVSNFGAKKDVKIFKKMGIQLLICALVYLSVYIIQNNNYFFSEDFINKTKELLSYDINFGEFYNNLKNQCNSMFNKDNGIGGAEEDNSSSENNAENENSKDNNGKDGTSESQNNQQGDSNQDINLQENTQQPDGQQQDNSQQESQQSDNKSNNQNANLTQEQKDIIDIQNTATFIKPVQGKISSKFGQRDTATGSVPKNHTGTDIAANIGTKIISSTDGEVVLKSEQGDYRKTFKNSNWKCECDICSLQ